MGCVTSKYNMGNHHPNIFNVLNVNDAGQVMSPGQLEVTEKELVLHQKGKEPVKWPLSYLRKYGRDLELFTFECGRRCPTGQGIYAFRCRKAEQLFNLVQQNLNVGNKSGGNELPSGGSQINIGIDQINPGRNQINTVASQMNSNNIDHPVPIAASAPPVPRRVLPQQSDCYLNSIDGSMVARPYPTMSRPGSMNSNSGHVSPSTISPPQSANDISSPENKRHSYTNHSVISSVILANSDNTLVSPNMYLSPVSSPTLPSENYVNVSAEATSHYINVNPGECSSQYIPNLTKDIPTQNFEGDLSTRSISEELEEQHCYVNIDTAERENLKPISSTNVVYHPSNSVPPTPTCTTSPKINYVDLQFVNPSNNTCAQKPESPDRTQESYAVIDPVKTSALLQSINNRRELDDGSRKTRHSSSILESGTSKQRSSLSD